MSEKYQLSTGAGLIEKDKDGNLYNSYVMAMLDGQIAKHKKLHAFVSEHMISGHEYTVFNTPHGCRVGILICKAQKEENG